MFFILSDSKQICTVWKGVHNATRCHDDRLRTYNTPAVRHRNVVNVVLYNVDLFPFLHYSVSRKADARMSRYCYMKTDLVITSGLVMAVRTPLPMTLCVLYVYARLKLFKMRSVNIRMVHS